MSPEPYPSATPTAMPRQNGGDRSSDTTSNVSSDELLDPAFLGRLRSLFVRVRRKRRMRKQGQQASLAAGHTREFKDHRAYTRGDDYRAIDWRLYARLDRLFIRVFEEIQELHVHVLIDTSASLGEPHSEKRREALRLAVALGYLALAGGHRLSLHALRPDAGGGSVVRELPPLKGQGHVYSLLKHCSSMVFAGSVDLGRALATFRPGADRKGVAFIVSDCYGTDPFASAEHLRRLRGWPLECHLVRVFHPTEAAPEMTGELRLEDVETGAARRVWLTRADLERYQRVYGEFAAGLQAACARLEVGYGAWSTADPFEDQFIALLERGGALASA